MAESPVKDKTSISASRGSRSEAETRANIKAADIKLDEPDFDADKCFENLSNTQSLGSLLRTYNKISEDSHELEAERQGLVYNHHHELIDASDTIKKIRDQTESLESSFDQLKKQFEEICKHAKNLKPPESIGENNDKDKDKNKNDGPSLQRQDSTMSTGSNSEEIDFDPLIHLPAILNIPTLLASEPRQSADWIWGRWEPVIRSWEENDVEGLSELISQCRNIMAEKRSATR